MWKGAGGGVKARFNTLIRREDDNGLAPTFTNAPRTVCVCACVRAHAKHEQGIRAPAGWRAGLHYKVKLGEHRGYR